MANKGIKRLYPLHKCDTIVGDGVSVDEERRAAIPSSATQGVPGEGGKRGYSPVTRPRLCSPLSVLAAEDSCLPTTTQRIMGLDELDWKTMSLPHHQAEVDPLSDLLPSLDPLPSAQDETPLPAVTARSTPPTSTTATPFESCLERSSSPSLTQPVSLETSPVTGQDTADLLPAEYEPVATLGHPHDSAAKTTCPKDDTTPICREHPALPLPMVAHCMPPVPGHDHDGKVLPCATGWHSFYYYRCPIPGCLGVLAIPLVP